MRDLGADQDLVNAGLFHSIYGTEGFQAFTVPITKRPEIRGLIGERAEQVCYGEATPASLSKTSLILQHCFDFLIKLYSIRRR